MSDALKTIDHQVIRAWIEAREGRPALVQVPDGAAVLCVDFGEREGDLEPIEWHQFFTILDDNDLAFLHQDLTADGLPSRFYQLVKRG